MNGFLLVFPIAVRDNIINVVLEHGAELCYFLYLHNLNCIQQHGLFEVVFLRGRYAKI